VRRAGDFYDVEPERGRAPSLPHPVPALEGRRVDDSRVLVNGDMFRKEAHWSTCATTKGERAHVRFAEHVSRRTHVQLSSREPPLLVVDGTNPVASINLRLVKSRIIDVG
jgi:hypothetical protein